MWDDQKMSEKQRNALFYSILSLLRADDVNFPWAFNGRLEIEPGPRYMKPVLVKILVHPYHSQALLQRYLLRLGHLPNPQDTWIGRISAENDWVQPGGHAEHKELQKHREDVLTAAMCVYDFGTRTLNPYQRAAANTPPICSLLQGHLAERNVWRIIMDYVRAPYGRILFTIGPEAKYKPPLLN